MATLIPLSGKRRSKLIIIFTYGLAVVYLSATVLLCFFNNNNSPSSQSSSPSSLQQQLRNGKRRLDADADADTSSTSGDGQQQAESSTEEHVLYRPLEPIKKMYPNIYSGTMQEPTLLDEQEATMRAKRAQHKVSPAMVNLEMLENMVGHAMPRADDPNVVQQLLSTAGPLPDEVRKNRVVYVITPTRTQKHQMLSLTRLMQTLQLAAYTQSVVIYWIVVEEAYKSTRRVRDLLESSGLPFAHASRPSYKGHVFGDDQRNEGLAMVKELGAEGVVYFAEEDNAYQVGLFGQLAETKKVGVVSVAFAGAGAYERCQAATSTTGVRVVQALYSNRPEEDKLDVDLASLAFTTNVLLTKRPSLKDPVLEKAGRRPLSLLEQVMDNRSNLQELQAIACDQPMAWRVVSSTPTEVLTVAGDEAASYLSLAV